MADREDWQGDEEEEEYNDDGKVSNRGASAGSGCIYNIY